jgi:hypothetical protein
MALATVSEEIMNALRRFNGISLDELDERASLLRRVDNKYVVPHDRFLELLRRLNDDHDVLDMDGRREFAYETVYFETPALRCFRDHVEGTFPRFKARTRLYRDTSACMFEVKLKDEDGETDKHQVEHPLDRTDELTEAARDCLRSALDKAEIELREPMEARLSTGFRRITLAARDTPQRLTCDVGVRLTGRDGNTAELFPDLVLVETKTEQGDSPADRVLNDLGLERISLSKYRVGVSLVGGAPSEEPQPGSEYFN